MNRAAMKRLYLRLMELAGQERRLVRRIQRGRFLAVLNLHRVSPAANPFSPPISPEDFEDLLVFLKRHFRIGSIREDLPHPGVLLSFDDGYQDFVEYAMPILAKHGIRANQNIIPQCVESGTPLWNVQLYDLLNCASALPLRRLRLPGFSFPPPGTSSRSKAAFGAALSGFLKMRSKREREELCQALVPLLEEVKPRGSTRMMDRDSVLQAAACHDIGVHSYAHESMGFESDIFFEQDLDRCEAYFRDVLHLPLDIYAFPNGSFRPTQIDILRAHGIRHVLLVEERFASGAGGVYPRISVSGESASEIRFQALGYRSRGVL